MPVIKCRHFNGYKPCGRNEICDSLCPSLSVPTSRVLIVHLEALGAVLRSTALLPAIRRKFPGCHITWVTQKPGDQLLKNNPLVDRVLTTSEDDLLALSALEFDVALCVDKSLKAAGVLKRTSFDVLFGFKVDPSNGAILPATDAASELWELGLSNRKKFYVNKKPETRLAHEALDLGPYMRDEYVLALSEAERRETRRRREKWARKDQVVVGINSGCANAIPHKKLTIEMHRDLIARLLSEYGRGPGQLPNVRVVLLGGKEDTVRNQRIAHGFDVVQSPTDRGLRDGLVSAAACDIVITGDSLGMHMAIALGKWTVAWFGPTCAHEIDLYDRGTAVLTRASCSPCWKRTCDKSPMCYDLVSVEDLLRGVREGEAWLAASEIAASLEQGIAERAL
jgi:heptosyltransferase-2